MLHSYAKEAEKERRRQKTEQLEWKTMDKYLAVDSLLSVYRAKIVHLARVKQTDIFLLVYNK